MRILVTGSIAYDRIMDFPGKFSDHILPEKLHQLSVGFFIQELKESFGGTGGNIAYSLALLGERPAVVSQVGKKDFAPYRTWLQHHGISLDFVSEVPGQQTAGAYIITDKQDNQITGFFPGALLKPWQGNTAKFKNFGLAIVSPQNSSDMVKFSKLFRKSGVRYIFDPGQQITALSSSQLRQSIVGSSVVIGNDYEVAILTKKTGWSLHQLLMKTPVLITTLGEKGSRIQTSKVTYRIPPVKPKKVVDPTGAGDAYRAGLLYGLSKNWPLPKVGRLAGVVAVHPVERYGTQEHTFTWTALSRRYRQNFGEGI